MGGLIKHLAHGERQWMDFAVGGPAAMFSGSKPWSEWDEADYARYNDGFRLTPGETLAGVLTEYEETARQPDG
ncbi:MAG: mycothiol transferase [Pseudonocardia sp.]